MSLLLTLDHVNAQNSQVYFHDLAGGRQLTYQQLHHQASWFAGQIRNRDGDPDRIALVVKDSLNLIPLVLACWSVGASAAIVDPDATEERIAALDQRIGFDLLVMDDGAMVEALPGRTLVVPAEAAVPSSSTSLDFTLDPADVPAIILFSSGTTGAPKCIPLSFNNILNNLEAFYERLGITAADRFFCTSPLWYSHGFYNSLLGALLLGSTVMTGGALNLLSGKKVLAEASRLQASIWHATPSMLKIINFLAQKFALELPPFRYVICGTSKLDLKEKAAFEERFQLPITQQYGMTEVLFISVNHAWQREKPTSVGVAVGCEVAIVDEAGEKRGPGEVGDIVVRSASSFGRYLGQESESAQAYRPDGFHTGDVGYLDEEGCLFITGRKKELIKKGGISIFPEEIDQCILELEGISESATVGVTSELYGEEIYTFVVNEGSLDEAAILEHCQKKLPATHMPRKIVFQAQLPKTSTGKIDKKPLRQSLDEQHIG